MSKIKLVVAIPAFNEERAIGKTVKNIRQSIKNYDFKILVVDDGSTDETKKVAQKAGAIVASHKRNLGLAEAFRTGMREALKLNADVIVHIDADGQFLPQEIPLLLNEINRGTDLVLGNRFSKEIDYMPLIKRFGNSLFSRVVSQIAKQKITDSQTGFRAFTKEIAKLQIRGAYSYTQEQIIRAAKENFLVNEVSVTSVKRSDGKSRLINNSFSYGIKTMLNIVRIYRDYAPLKFFGSFGSLIFALGVISGLWVLYLNITAGTSGHFALMVLTIILILTGLQIILFGFLADMKGR